MDDLREHIIKKINTERELRDWTEYELSKRAGIPQSTISTWSGQKLIPTVQSLQKICKAFDMPMSQFLAEDDQFIDLNKDEQDLLVMWKRLSPTQKNALLELLKSFTSKT